MKEGNVKKELTILFLGCVLYSISIIMTSTVYLIPGSTLSIAVVINKLWGLPAGTLNLLMNVPIMIFCTAKFGKKVLFYTIFFFVASAVMIDIGSLLLPAGYSPNSWVITLLATVPMGVGAGWIMVAGGTMGGTTAIARIIKVKIPKSNIGNSLIIMDSSLAIIGAIALESFQALAISLTYTFIVSKIIGKIYPGDGDRFIEKKNTDSNMQEV